MNADGSDVTRITTDPGNDIDPAWSPDGTAIAFTREGNLWITRNGVETLIADLDPNISLPDWSPDGTKIAFHISTGGPIVVVDPDGNHLGAPIEGFHAAWSPDGARIAVAKRIGMYGVDIFVGDADGSNEVNVTNLPAAGNLEPSWQPIAPFEPTATRTQTATATPTATPQRIGGVAFDLGEDIESSSRALFVVAGMVVGAVCLVLGCLCSRARKRRT